MTEDPEQANRSRHHSAFRRDDAAAHLRQDDFKVLRAVMVREGIGEENIAAYLRTLAEPNALEAAVKWYQANKIAAMNVPQVSVPTLYIWGTADATVGRRAAELTGEFVTGPYRFVEIEGGGHFTVDQFPARTASLVLAHLRTVV
jgi:pimeloyl-ACP methyl ester carboxylesterase